jgi:hypothetical protein
MLRMINIENKNTFFKRIYFIKKAISKLIKYGFQCGINFFTSIQNQQRQF